MPQQMGAKRQEVGAGRGEGRGWRGAARRVECLGCKSNYTFYFAENLKQMSYSEWNRNTHTHTVVRAHTHTHTKEMLLKYSNFSKHRDKVTGYKRSVCMCPKQAPVQDGRN